MAPTEQAEIIAYAKELLRHNAQAIESIVPQIDSNFVEAVEAIVSMASQGHVILSGMGKAGIIGMKISATLASIGIPSFFLHPAEAIHGDLGRFSNKDLALLLSNSGETDEVIRIISPIKKIGCRIISLTANPNSTLGRNSDICLTLGAIQEAGPLGLAPTTSTSMMLAYGDALAMCALRHKNISVEQFAFYHPGGSLGRALMKVEELMRTGEHFCVVQEAETCRTVIQKIAATKGRPGAAAIVNSEGRLVGIFTDGDLRTHLSRGMNFLDQPVKDFMGRSPKVVSPVTYAQEALATLRKHNIDQLIVLNEAGSPLGLVDIQDLI
jgi:arabinose-5-phosphate isomerase